MRLVRFTQKMVGSSPVDIWINPDHVLLVRPDGHGRAVIGLIGGEFLSVEGYATYVVKSLESE